MNRILCFVCTLCLLGLMVLPTRVEAWGPEGHEIVADVAEHYLTPITKATVQDILGSQQLSDFEICVWPDLIRGDKEYEALYPGNGHWHYIDFDVSQHYDEDFELKPPEDGQDVVSQIGRFSGVLSATDSTPEQQLDAIRFLTHFVADLHQPMHCAYRYGDMGGNMIPIHSFNGKNYAFDADTPMDYEPNLHSMWDEYLVKELIGTASPDRFARKLVKQITPEQIRYWQARTPLDWAIDSYWKARKQAYRWTDGTKLPYKWARPGMDLTSENYIDSHLPLVREQLEKAGIRLAQVLNTALDPAYRPAPATEAAPRLEPADAAK